VEASAASFANSLPRNSCVLDAHFPLNRRAFAAEVNLDFEMWGEINLQDWFLPPLRMRNDLVGNVDLFEK
jgi:hypothetical protein